MENIHQFDDSETLNPKNQSSLATYFILKPESLAGGGGGAGLFERFKAEIYPLRFCCFAAVKT